MALVLNDRVKETTTTTGTGTINLAGAETGFESFVAGVGNSNTCYYCIAHQSANEFEVGLGTVTDASPDTLARTTIISSSNSDSAVDFSAGTKDVFCTLPASKAVAIPTSGDMTIDVPGDIIFDVDGGDILFKDAGTLVGTIGGFAGNNVTIKSEVSDGDVIFQGNDGGTAITPFKLDMSSGGRALFFSDLLALETVGQYLQMAGSSSTYWAIGSTGGSNPPGTASTTLAFHHYDGSAWNNEVEFNSSGDITADGNLVLGGTATFKFLNTAWINSADGINRLYYTANSTSFYKTADDHVFRNASDANRFSIDNSGNGVFSGNVTGYGSPSDLKLKEDIEVIDNAVDKIKQLKGITYTLKSDGNRLTGLVAQDLEKVLPEAVYTEKDIETKDEHLAIRYGNTVGLLVEAIKEQQEQIETLNDYVKLQSASIMDMERRLNELENK